MAPIADDLRIVRAAADRAVVDADAAVAEADRAGIAVGVLGANFPLRSTLRRGLPRNIPASREGRKDTSQHFCPGNLWRSSEGRRMFRQRLRTRMRLRRRRAIRLLSISMNLPRMNRKRLGTCRRMCRKMRRKDCVIR